MSKNVKNGNGNEAQVVENEVVMAAPAPIEQPKFIPQSDKLAELEAQLITAKQEYKLADESNEDEIFNRIKDVKNAIRAEISKLEANEIVRVKMENDAKRIQPLTDLFAAAKLSGQNDTPENNDFAQLLFEQCKLLILGGTTKARTVATNGTTKVRQTSSKGLPADVILEMHKKNVAAKMTDTESRNAIEAAGGAKSSTWHVVNKYNKGILA